MISLHEFIIQPDIAFILITFGVYGVLLELTNPGGFIPGIFGFMCFVIGIVALNSLPVNYTGLALMGLGVALMAAEAFLPTFGLLGVGGGVSFAAGGAFLIDEKVYGTGVSWWLIGVNTALTLAVITYVLITFIKSKNAPVTTGTEALKNSLGEVISWHDNKGEVLASGARWQAKAPHHLVFRTGEKVKITEIEGVTLIIDKEEK